MTGITKRKVIRVNSIAPMMEAYFHDQALAFREWYDMVYVSSPGKEHEHMRRDGIRTEQIYIARPISPLQDLVSLWRLYRFFRKERPDIVHSVTPKAGLLSMIAGWLAGVPVRIHTFTGLLFPWRKGMMHHVLKTTDRITCYFATHLNPEGEGVRKLLIEAHITSKPLPVLGHGNIRGINLAKYSPKGAREKTRRELQLPTDSFVFAFTGRLVRDKGINELCAAFARLSEEYPQAYLLLIGPEEPELDPLDAETKEIMGKHSRIRAVGHRDDIPALLEASDAFVFPSYREGFPNAILEAQAYFLPCIATDVCGCNEIVIHEENGILIPRQDASALYLAMKRLITLPQAELQAMGYQGRQQIERFFSADMVNRNLHQFYESLTA